MQGWTSFAHHHRLQFFPQHDDMPLAALYPIVAVIKSVLAPNTPAPQPPPRQPPPQSPPAPPPAKDAPPPNTPTPPAIPPLGG